MTREKLALKGIDENDIGFVSEQPIAVVVYSFNNSKETMQARLRSMQTFRLIHAHELDVHTLTDEQLGKLPFYAYNAETDTTIRSSSALNKKDSKLTPEAKREKIECILALQDNAAMWPVENPEAWQEDVQHLLCDYGPIDFTIRYVSQVYSQTQYKRFFAACANPEMYFQFSGVISFWISAIQPLHVRDIEGLSLMPTEQHPARTLQLDVDGTRDWGPRIQYKSRED